MEIRFRRLTDLRSTLPSKINSIDILGNLVTGFCSYPASGAQTLNILVTVDYTALSNTSAYIVDVQSGPLMWIGLGDTPEDIIQTTTPIALIRNIYLVGSWSVIVRSKFGDPPQPYWGILQGYNTFRIAEAVIYGNSPDGYTPSKINTSSILLFRPPDLIEYPVVTDVSINSVLHGLSNIGGIFTAANGVFIFVFGWGIIEVLGLGHFALLRRDKNNTGKSKDVVAPTKPDGEEDNTGFQEDDVKASFRKDSES